MKAQRHNKNGDEWRRTFREIVDESRPEAARQAWERAKTTSAIRHHLRDRRRHSAARHLGRIKHAAISRAIELAPEHVLVTLDTDFQVGLLSIRFNGRGRLHLPAAAQLGRPGDAVHDSKRSA